jgi:diguanylate cyclase (GGDEF)-like protein/PAS domain S-box-containing protein
VIQPQRRSVRWAGLVLALCCVFPVAVRAHTPTRADDVHIAVLAYDEKSRVRAQLQPLIDLLQAHSPDLDIQLDVLDMEELEYAARGNAATVIITNPYHYLSLRSSDKLARAFATVFRASPSERIASLGGTIVARSDDAGTRALTDLAGATIAIANRRSTGGYLLPLAELDRAGVDTSGINWLEVGTQQRALAAVRDGDADAAFLRSSTLESAVAHGDIAADTFAVINRQALADYPFAVSTRLYPEWPVVSVGATDPATLQQLLGVALLRARELGISTPGAIAGFAPPADYSVLRDEVRRLALPPFDAPPEVSLADIWRAHRLAGSIALFTGLLIAGLLIALFERNRRLQSLWHDLRESLRAQEEDRRRLADLNRHFEMFLERTTDYVYFKDAHRRYIFASRAMAELTGHANRDEMAGKTDLDVFPLELAREYVEQETDLFATRKPIVDQRQRYRRLDGSMGWVSTYKWPILSPDGEEVLGLFGISRDVTELHDYERQLERAAHHDPLTGLPNRSLFFDRLHQAMAATERRDNELAVVYVDIDRFKQVNDDLGHAAGDELLVNFARLLSSIVRKSDTVARLGGDEFVLLLPDIRNRDECTGLLDRLMEAMAEPQTIAGRELEVTVSAGLAFYSGDMPDDPDQLLHRADEAMYEAKQAGRNQYRLRA